LPISILAARCNCHNMRRDGKISGFLCSSHLVKLRYLGSLCLRNPPAMRVTTPLSQGGLISATGRVFPQVQGTYAVSRLCRVCCRKGEVMLMVRRRVRPIEGLGFAELVNPSILGWLSRRISVTKAQPYRRSGVSWNWSIGVHSYLLFYCP
jgi:hypothetical protein